jgi:WD40 repeat protein
VVKVWGAIAGPAVLMLQRYTGYVYNATWNPDGKRLASASTDQTVKI